MFRVNTKVNYFYINVTLLTNTKIKITEYIFFLIFSF